MHVPYQVAVSSYATLYGVLRRPRDETINYLDHQQSSLPGQLGNILLVIGIVRYLYFQGRAFVYSLIDNNVVYMYVYVADDKLINNNWY